MGIPEATGDTPQTIQELNSHTSGAYGNVSRSMLKGASRDIQRKIQTRIAAHGEELEHLK